MESPDLKERDMPVAGGREERASKRKEKNLVSNF